MMVVMMEGRQAGRCDLTLLHPRRWRCDDDDDNDRGTPSSSLGSLSNSGGLPAIVRVIIPFGLLHDVQLVLSAQLFSALTHSHARLGFGAVYLIDILFLPIRPLRRVQLFL